MEVKETSQSMRIGGASIAWITLYGALCGVTSLIPVFPYVGGGGYVPLQTMFSAIAPVLLGGVGGIVAATVGGIIGMFIAPAAFPLQLVDVILTGFSLEHSGRHHRYRVPVLYPWQRRRICSTG